MTLKSSFDCQVYLFWSLFWFLILVPNLVSNLVPNLVLILVPILVLISNFKFLKSDEQGLLDLEQYLPWQREMILASPGFDLTSI